MIAPGVPRPPNTEVALDLWEDIRGCRSDVAEIELPPPRLLALAFFRSNYMDTRKKSHGKAVLKLVTELNLVLSKL